jgi:KDO2-lipid IV(A) lauroyltransferase
MQDTRTALQIRREQRDRADPPTSRHRLEAWAVVTMLGVIAHAPLGFSRGLARLVDRITPRSRRRAIYNLSMALPGVDAGPIVDGMYASIGRMLYYFARFPTRNASNISEWIEYDGLEHYREAKAAGKGVLFATGHLGNWELSAFAHALLSEPMTVLVRELDNRVLNALVARYRTRSGNTLIDKQDFLRRIVTTLRANGAVGMLIDQNVVPWQGTFVEFFGMQACTGTALARIAKSTGAAVVPGYALWDARKGKYVLRFDPVFPMSGDVAVDTARLAAHFEAVIRRDPAQWLWVHRRWETRPVGEPPLY